MRLRNFLPIACLCVFVFAGLQLSSLAEDGLAGSLKAASGSDMKAASESDMKAASESDMKAASESDTKAGKTYTLNADGSTDWFTYHGFIMYGVNCYKCHGPGAIGSTFAPSLVDAVKRLDLEEFTEIVADGRSGRMPAFKGHYGVECSIDHLYAYLKARSDGAVKGGELLRVKRPKVDKNVRYAKYKECIKSARESSG